MIDGLFAEDGDEDFCVLSAEQAKSDSMAGEMHRPPNPRSPSNFVGLLNQGATCYLNSLFQALFMTPELRSAIFSLKLFENSINEPSEWLPAGQKREILTALQELFVKLAFIDEQAISTQALTKSFGWTGEEVVVQHDVQELSRVFFDCLDRVLQGTQYSELVSSHIKGKFVNSTTCRVCFNESPREEDFADIGLRVKGLSGLLASLEDLTKDSILDGSNQYFCEICQKKVDATRRTRISKLPKLLNFSLNRFEYDNKTYERMKINSNFEFPLELDMSVFCDSGSIYELFAVIIHGGGAHSGHYHAYIRDIFGQGHWEPGAPSVDPIKPQVNPEKAQSRKKKNKKNRGKKRAQKKKEPKEEINFDAVEFSENPEDVALLMNWFDFNDSVVTPIRSGRLKKQFGGSSETAYILIYRAKDLPSVVPPEVPSYWAPVISSLNEDYKKHRVLYEEQKNIIEVQIQPFDLFDFSDDAFIYKDQETSSLSQGISLKLEKTDLVEDLKNHLTITLIEDFPDLFNSHQIFISQPLSSKCVHILRSLETLENDSTLSKENIFHKACFLILPRDNEKIESILENIGPDCEPLSLSCNFSGEKFSVICNKGWSVLRLKEKISNYLKLDLNQLEFKYRKSEGGEKKLTSRDDDSSLIALKFYHSMTLTISLKDSEIPMVELKKNDQGEDLVTVLLTDELQTNNPVQHLVIREWRVKDLIQEARVVFAIEPETPVRLRKLVDGKVVCREDLDSFLKNIPEFLDGGYRFQVERGEPPGYGLIVVKVAFEPNDSPKEIFVKETEKVADVKKRAAEVLGFNPDLFKLYRTDWLKDPINALKQENLSLFKVAVKDCDLLLVKSVDTVVESETLRIHFCVRLDERPNGFKPACELSLPEDTLMKSLKEILQGNKDVNPLGKNFVRVRELTKTLWPGKVYKEDNKTLKKLAISFGSSLLVEPLDTNDASSFTGVQIFIGLRDSCSKSTQNIIDTFFDSGASPNIDHLYHHAISLFNLTCSPSELVLARFKSNSFEWEVLKDDRPAEEKGKLLNSRTSNTAQGIHNLKKKPYFLKDGDFFAVKLSRPDNLDDDFVCVGDAEAREAYLKRRQLVGKTTKLPKAEKSIKIGDF